MSADLERLAAEFEKFQAKIKQAEVKFSGVGDMQERLGQLQAAAVSPDRTVRVVAGAGGTVLDLQLTPDAVRQPAPQLAATIMATLRQAVAEAVRMQAGIVDETVGEAFGLNTTDQVKAAQAEALGTATQELTSHHSQQAPAPKRPVKRDDDDYFDGYSVYGDEPRH
ncbi:YbaB/EbfC family nucleoid-associated protein [Crossiella sp. SN42]|uniref:YbaB/EbfC family nucleoid-associated protein n=1 Tax=Crossiella sp. SN42 TaxID=2944808 RepID=UPI00207CF64D|nr:YbaB/EbfC family nucleoid-associated protein [Crossiella sp. SN42]MCO1581886.1 YbaB/EbfC family nucleoid-associated protein [Crossiella sp. SN42]